MEQELRVIFCSFSFLLICLRPNISFQYNVLASVVFRSLSRLTSDLVLPKTSNPDSLADLESFNQLLIYLNERQKPLIALEFLYQTQK